MSVQKVLLWPFLFKPRQSGLSLDCLALQDIPQVPENRAQKLESERLKSFAVSISLQTKAIRGYAHRDCDQLRLDIPELGGYIPVLGTLN